MGLKNDSFGNKKVAKDSITGYSDKIGGAKWQAKKF